MTPKAERDELADIVEEIATIEEAQRQGRLTEAEAKEVLHELDIAPECLGAARMEIARKRANDEQRKARQKVIVVVAALLVGMGGLIVARERSHSTAFAEMAAKPAGMTENDAPLSAPFMAHENGELEFDVTLIHAPKSGRLELSCDWAAPDESVKHQNRWETKPIDRDPFPTHCRYDLGPNEPQGRWTVTMRWGNSSLATSTFQVE